MMSGKMIISLDFEGMWGSIGSIDTIGFCERTKHINEYVIRLLELFKKYDIHATWGFVGAMLCDDSEEALEYLKEDIIYERFRISMREYIKNIAHEDSKKYFLKNLITEIKLTPNQELASHTFSHFYTLEQNATKELMIQELVAFNKISEKHGIKVKTIIMPRNMINKEYFSVISKFGITAIRGRQNVVFRRSNKERNKVFDFFDSYLPLRRDLCYKPDEITCFDGVYNIKASMFFRTYDKRFRLLEKLKIKRIKIEMLRAAKEKKVFHLWWHPHNMASNLEWNFGALEELFKYYAVMKKKYDFESSTMGEVVNSICSRRDYDKCNRLTV